LRSFSASLTDSMSPLPPQLSMKEVGDGLHEQMTCMMGALQELKLLQVQTALEQLEISGSRSAGPGSERPQRCRSGREAPRPGPGAGRHSEPWPGKAPADDGGTARSQPCRAAASVRRGRAAGTPGHGDCQGCDDGNDWTSSLMSQSRNRQPLVLGDNIFADLVGNWLDLPELDKKGEKSEASLSMSRSQELYRKFSLTANIFKKFLRSVRPDRDRLLKEKPCWLPPEDKQPEISKRPKKMNKLKGTFYFPLHGNTQNNHSKAERCPKVDSNSDKPRIGTKKVHDTIDYPQSGFDINTAVWV
ncbi:INKA2 protein, partial [Dromaius novaehollandiae]|nr:INKA2 protein [Dromaius novaehollandiae]